MSADDPARAFNQSLSSGGARDELTYDLSAFEALDGEQKTQALNELLNRVEGGNDARAVETLGFAQDSAVMEQIAPWSEGSPGPVRSAARRALVRLQPSKEHIASLQQDMQEYTAEISSIYSAVLLREVGGATEAHIAALDHPSDLTRHHATEALIEQFGLEEHDSVFESRLRVLQLLNGIQLPTPLAEGRDGLAEIFRALQGGAPVESLDLGYSPGTHSKKLPEVLKAVFERDGPSYPAEDIKKLDGDDAYCIRGVMFNQLSGDHDPRALEGIIATKPEGWRTILEEELSRETALRTQSPEAMAIFNDLGIDMPEVRITPWLKLLRAALAELD